MPPLLENPDVLLVEDDESHAELIVRCLENLAPGIKVVVAPTGEDFLEALRGRGLRPRLIMLDINMPRMTGLEALAIVKADAALQMIPVVMMTSSDAESDRLKAYRLHANGFVTKPGDFAQLKECLRHIHAYWMMSNLTAESPRLSF